MKAFVCSSLFFFSVAVSAQTGIGTSSPNASAQLDVSSTTKGFLPPRLTYAQKMAITSPAAGLIIYCTNCGTYGEIEFYNGIEWMNISGSPAALPVSIAATTSASNIKAYNATSGGNITSTGGLTITARGLCWSTTSSPNVSLSTKTVVSGTTGAFTSIISGLNPGTLYYVRSYATTSAGTVYGAETNFTSGTLTSGVFGFESGAGFPVTYNGTVWSTDGAWNDIRDYNGTVYAGSYAWLVSFNNPSNTVTLSNSYDFDAGSIYVKRDGMSNSTVLTIICYDADNQQVGATINASISDNYEEVIINRSRVRKIVFSQNGVNVNEWDSQALYFDNLSFSQ